MFWVGSFGIVVIFDGGKDIMGIEWIFFIFIRGEMIIYVLIKVVVYFLSDNCFKMKVFYLDFKILNKVLI